MKKKPSLTLAAFPLVFLLIILTVGYGVFRYRAEPLLVLAAFAAGAIAVALGYTWKELQQAIVEKIARALPAILILWSVGFLIGSWMFSGTVPMIIYYGVQIISPRFLLVTAFILTALVSTVTGTSWGSAGTVGVAIMGIAAGLGVSLPAAAGAVVAGAYFGDKMSPLSDTTNLAPIAAGSELYEHIRHMFYTTIPASVIALLIYLFVGMTSTSQAATPEKVQLLMTQLDGMFHWNFLILLPVVLVLFGSLRKWPVIPTLLGTSFISLILGIIIQGFSLKNGLLSLISGFKTSMTNFEGEAVWEVTRLIDRGGVSSVTSTTVLILCAMGFAGIATVTGMLDTVLNAMMKMVKRTAGIIISTIVSCFVMAFATGSSYLTILIPGELFKHTYVQRGLHPKNLSRTLEDSGTVLVPLVPWSAAGAYMTATLGVSTFEYAPWALLNYLGILFAIVLAFTGFGIAKLTKEEQAAFEEEFHGEETQTEA